MQLEMPFEPELQNAPAELWLKAGAARVRLHLVRHRRARRYVLRLRADGSARVTIPRGGSVVEARRFAERHAAWLERQLLRRAAQPATPAAWSLGSSIFFRGELVRVEPAANGNRGSVCLGPEVLRVKNIEANLRPEIEKHLWRLARKELPQLVFALAKLHQLPARRVTVRNQRSRWGSCSRHGTISLNWRLVQAPLFVRDYIVLHELAHLKEMNHSPRFWRQVAALCPAFAEAERWLKQHALPATGW